MEFHRKGKRHMRKFETGKFDNFFFFFGALLLIAEGEIITGLSGGFQSSSPMTRREMGGI